MELKDVVKALSALAQPNRLQVFRALVAAGKAGATPGQLSEHLGVPGTTLSFHLKELMGAGLISQQRSGRYLIYRVEFLQMNQVLAYLTENCCEGVQACLDTSAFLCDCDEGAHDDNIATFERPLPLHAQLGAQHPGGGPAEPPGSRPLQGLFGGQQSA